MTIGEHVRESAGSKRLRCATVVASAACVVVGLAGGGVADAATAKASSVQVLHFFSKPQSMTVSTAAGKPFSPSKTNPPAVGDEFDSTDLDYVGNHLHHAATWAASDDLLCIVAAKGDPVCYGQIAIGSSMILLRGLATRATSTPIIVTGGTGRFKGVTGSLVSVNIDPSSDTSSSDLTITLRRP